MKNLKKHTQMLLTAVGLGITFITASSFAGEPETPVYYQEISSTGFKSVPQNCSTQPTNLTIAGFKKDGTNYEAGSFSLKFGTGNGVQKLFNCGAGGDLTICQVIDCSGKTIALLMKK